MLFVMMSSGFVMPDDVVLWSNWLPAGMHGYYCYVEPLYQIWTFCTFLFLSYGLARTDRWT